MTRLVVVIALTVTAAFAQYGQYPPGGYPGSIRKASIRPGKIRMVSIRRDRGRVGESHYRTAASARKKRTNRRTPFRIFIRTAGCLRAPRRKFQIGTDDGRLITFKLDDTSKFTKDGNPATSAQAPANTYVHVDAFEDDEFYLTAATVDVRKDPTTQKANVAAGDRPTLKREPSRQPHPPQRRQPPQQIMTLRLRPIL